LVDFTGVNEQESFSFDIYPNPSQSGAFSVRVKGDIQSINVMDMTGRGIDLPTNVAEGTINGATLSSGNYIVRVTTKDDKTIQRTVIVQK
jgi:hypothetical protein